MKTQFNFTIDAALLEQLRQIAASRDLSVAQLLRRLVLECIAQDGEQK